MKAEKNEYTDRYVWTDSLYKRMEDVKGIVSVLRGISPRPDVYKRQTVAFPFLIFLVRTRDTTL